MDENRDGRIVIGFHYIDELGNEYSQETKCESFPDYGYDNLDVMGEQLDAFLSQCGFIRKGYILMESLTEDEVTELTCYLAEYRTQKKEQLDENNN